MVESGGQHAHAHASRAPLCDSHRRLTRAYDTRMPQKFTVRIATQKDAALIARHRAEMFADMGQLPGDLYQALVARSVEYLREALPAGAYVGWLASPPGHDDVIAGAGVQLRRTLPHPLTRDGQPRIALGRQAIVLNVFTEKAWRRQGLAELLMAHVIDWARASAIDTLVLHASAQGKPLYHRLGFVSTTEMRYQPL
jgi:GNAT superfamily N-acetyltransferase